MDLKVAVSNGHQLLTYLELNAHRLPHELVSKWAQDAFHVYGYIVASCLLSFMEAEEVSS